MCNKYNAEDSKRYMKLGEYAARVLKGETLEDIANTEDKPLKEVENEFRAIKPINPYLYKQIFGED